MAHNKNLYEEKYKQQINKTALDCKNVLKHNKFLIYQKQIIVYTKKTLTLSEIH